jgi:hypothetical protein
MAKRADSTAAREDSDETVGADTQADDGEPFRVLVREIVTARREEPGDAAKRSGGGA